VAGSFGSRAAAACPPNPDPASRSANHRLDPISQIDDNDGNTPDQQAPRAMFRVTVSGPREQEASFFTVVVWRDQAEHVAESLSKGSRIVVVGRLQQRSWTAEDSSARSIVEVVADELGPSLRWATATTTRTARNQHQ
jgi:single stranded DNA-binding protein